MLDLAPALDWLALSFPGMGSFTRHQCDNIRTKFSPWCRASPNNERSRFQLYTIFPLKETQYQYIFFELHSIVVLDPYTSIDARTMPLRRICKIMILSTSLSTHALFRCLSFFTAP